MRARVPVEHDWTAKDGKVWAFRLVFVELYDEQGRLLPDFTSGVAVVMSEDDIAELGGS